MQCRGSREGGAGGQKLKIGMQPQAAAQAKQDCWCSSPDEISIVYVGHSPQQCSAVCCGTAAASNCTAQRCEKCFQLTPPPQRAAPLLFAFVQCWAKESTCVQSRMQYHTWQTKATKGKGSVRIPYTRTSRRVGHDPSLAYQFQWFVNSCSSLAKLRLGPLECLTFWRGHNS